MAERKLSPASASSAPTISTGPLETRTPLYRASKRARLMLLPRAAAGVPAVAPAGMEVHLSILNCTVHEANAAIIIMNGHHLIGLQVAEMNMCDAVKSALAVALETREKTAVFGASKSPREPFRFRLDSIKVFFIVVLHENLHTSLSSFIRRDCLLALNLLLW